MNKKVIRVIALILAVLMAGGVLVSAVFSLGARAASTVPVTGDQRSSLPIYLVVGGVVVVAVCVAAPMLLRKKPSGDDGQELDMKNHNTHGDDEK